jgi:hypothetical protein
MIYKIAKYPSKPENNQLGLFISSTAAEQLNLKNGSNLILQCGLKSINVVVNTTFETELNDKILWVTENVLEELFLPEPIEIRIQILKSENIMKIGPIIGILVEEHILKKYKKGRQTREAFECYANAGTEVGALAYAFSLSDIDLNNKRIKGYVSVKSNSKTMSWQEQWLPVPDAIHNRVKKSYSKSEYKKIQEIKKLPSNIIIINRVTNIYKWRVQKILEKDMNAKKYLPKTVLFKGAITLTRMLREFPTIYLKPVGRSLGLGIVRITKESQDSYTAKYTKKRTTYSITGTVPDILFKLKSLMGKRTYIVQQGIPLATYKGSIFDLRVSVQKNGTGVWGVSRWKVRVASSGNIVTNLSAGGYGAHLEKIMNLVFKDYAVKVMNEIKLASLDICSALENELDGIGDIGLDIGVTENGKIYFIEANFRELRLNSGSAEDSENWANTFKNPIFYLNYLYNTKLQNDYLI